MSLDQFLSRPYPFYSSSKEALRLVVFISIFISLFCFIFQPFGIDEPIVGNSLLISVGFGLLTLIASLFNMVMLPRIIPKLFSLDKWTVGKEILWVIYMLLVIALVNWVYALQFYEQPQPDLLSYLVVATYTVLVGLMPAIGVIMYKESRSLQDRIDEAYEKLETTREGIASFISENEKEKISIPRSDLLLIASAGNYSEIYYQQNEKIEKALLRNKISNLEQAVSEFPEIMRCHRKFVINTDKILKVEGHSSGYKVKLFQFDETVPVSKSYANQVYQMRLQGSS